MITRRRNYITAFPDGSPEREDAVTRLRSAAETGDLPEFVDSIKGIVGKPITRLLNKRYSAGDYMKNTVLIVAACKGHVAIVQYIVNKYNVDINAKATERRLGFRFDDEVTALWCAAASGYFDIVKVLVEKGANVDCFSSTGSTPLRAACHIGQFKIVRFLINHGANVNATREHHSTCLMVAVYKGHRDIVDYLLENGADVNMVTSCRSTAMHFAVKYNHPAIVRTLISYNAKQLKNKDGSYPIMIAADRSDYHLVYLLLNNSNFTREERIEIEELLGASFFNNRDKYGETDRGFSILLNAMELRWEHPVIHKKPFKLIEAYDNRIECQTVQELLNLKNNIEALNYESMVIRERILGDTNPDLLRPLVYLGSTYWDRNNYIPCLKLWYHAVKIAQKNKRRISVHILRFLRVFRRMIIAKIVINLSYLKNVLYVVLNELKTIQNNLSEINSSSKKKLKEAEYAETIKLTLGLITITSIALDQDGNSEDPLVEDIMKTIAEIVQLDLRKNNNQTLLHLSLNYCTIVDNEYADAIYCYPNYLLMKLLIDCGADVNAIDNSQNTPLHLIGKFIDNFPDLPHENDDAFTKQMVLELLNAGAHTDYVNKYGDCPHTGYLKTLLNLTNKMPRQLQCLSAHVLKCSISKKYYEDKLPTKLIAFTNSH